ncbi:hypothetical protein [Streptomyces flaveolus]|uniref:hypothetical protein n=1 Tax=Streptomyces flaveolus TaxID=67297 RepID=UPI0037013261
MTSTAAVQAAPAAISKVLTLAPECRSHPQNWISLALTALFAGALLHGRREFYARGDRSNSRGAFLTAAGGLLVTSLLVAFLVTVADEAPESSAFAERWSYGLMRAVSMEPARGEFPGISIGAVSALSCPVGWCMRRGSLPRTALFMRQPRVARSTQRVHRRC